MESCQHHTTPHHSLHTAAHNQHCIALSTPALPANGLITKCVWRHSSHKEEREQQTLRLVRVLMIRVLVAHNSARPMPVQKAVIGDDRFKANPMPN